MMAEKQPRKPTIRDVAELVGVHHTTVSRALNPTQRTRISADVVREVEKAAKKLGYLPNLAASSLRSNRSFAIGVLVPDITNPIFPPIIRAIQDVAEEAGFTVIIANTDDNLDKEARAFRMMRSRAMEGIVILTARLDDPAVDECVKDGIPCVLVNRTVRNSSANALIVDEDFGVRSALDHLVELGHSQIAYIAGPQDTSTGAERAQAFWNYMKLLDLDASLCEYTNRFTIEEGQRACNSLIERERPFTAILAGNDLTALGCIDALEAHGLSVPQDVSIIGGNDIPLLSRMSPALTSIHIPTYRMGSQAMSMLLEIIDGSHHDPVTLRVQPRLVVRDSTATL